MSFDFESVPQVVVDYVRGVFAAANDKVARAMADQPALHEPFLDNLLITELTVTAPVFFAKERAALAIETHWLGGRWMYDRFEVADIALFLIIRRQGKLETRKVALLQTKRLYTREIPLAELDEADFVIGIGRLADQVEPRRPLTQQRAFTFNSACTYDATTVGDDQIARIDAYVTSHALPVYYGLYNPLAVPMSGLVPAAPGANLGLANAVGVRVLPAADVHGALAGKTAGQHPSFADLTVATPLDAADAASNHGWRLERFVADELLRCRQGQRFDSTVDPNLDALLYRRSAPITAAVSITIDLDEEVLT